MLPLFVGWDFRLNSIYFFLLLYPSHIECVQIYGNSPENQSSRFPCIRARFFLIYFTISREAFDNVHFHRFFLVTIMLNQTSRSLILASFIGGFAEALFIPVYAPFIERIGGSIIDVGIGFAVFNITVGLFIVIFGSSHFFERNVSRMLIFGCVLLGIADFSLLIVHTQIQFFAVQVFFGVGLGIFNPAWDAMYSEDHTISQTKKWSLWTGGVTFVIGIASLVGVVIVKYVGFNGLFITMGAVDMIAVVYAIRAHQHFTLQLVSNGTRNRL
jgi:hypothetical protein